TEREVDRGARPARRAASTGWRGGWTGRLAGLEPGRRMAVRVALAVGLVVLGVAIGMAARRLAGGDAPASVSSPPPGGAAAPGAADASTEPALRTAAAGPSRALPEPEAPRADEKTGAPAPGDTRAGASGDGDASAPLVEDLGTLLARRSPAATAADALDGLLEAWGQRPVQAELLSREQLLTVLAAEGLRAEPVAAGSLDETLAWDLPLLLELRALDGLPRLVAVLAADETGVRVRGLDEEPRRVARADLGAHLGDRGWVVWRDLGELPGVLRPGADTEAVDWLQGALSLLGLWSGPATGRYDAATIAGVRAFQAREGLEVDGTVGTRTRLRLYARLPTYELPRLGVAPVREDAP
ncbi:MAG: peptidoglycan-binding domain-containing protein, partial [Myxococcota bacterium]|nr:peptidoglycan-binding domain-containing protein [Myxococcota bacterium]